MDRREFLKTAAVAAAATALSAKLPAAKLLAKEETDAPSEVIAVRNGDPVTMFQKGIEQLGSMTRFVKPGNKVVVKPNIGWARTVEEAANTNPELVAEIIRQCLACGASEVVVFDHSCNEQEASYTTSGIAEAVEKAGGKMLGADRESNYRNANAPRAISMKKAKIHKAILDADVFINVPILKNHGGAKMTAAMKNFMGIVWDRQFMHKNNLPQAIADSILYRKPDLNIVDAYRIMVSNGPRGVSTADVQELKYQLLSTDIIAIDTVACKLMRYDFKSVPYIALGEAHGLGCADESKIKITRLEC